MQVIHHPRVAWDTARVFVGAAPDDELFGWLSNEVGELLGPGAEEALAETRDRLRWATTGDLALVEAGRWRVRLEDTLRARPEVAEPLRTLTTIASGLLRDRRRDRPSPVS